MSSELKCFKCWFEELNTVHKYTEYICKIQGNKLEWFRFTPLSMWLQSFILTDNAPCPHFPPPPHPTSRHPHPTCFRHPHPSTPQLCFHVAIFFFFSFFLFAVPLLSDCLSSDRMFAHLFKENEVISTQILPCKFSVACVWFGIHVRLFIWREFGWSVDLFFCFVWWTILSPPGLYVDPKCIQCMC